MKDDYFIRKLSEFYQTCSFLTYFFPWFLIFPIFLCFLVQTAFKGIWKLWEFSKYIPFDTADTLLICYAIFPYFIFMWVSMIKSFSRSWSFVVVNELLAFGCYCNTNNVFIHSTAFNRECCYTANLGLP